MEHASPFICSASVFAYEVQGKETWYQIQVIPRVEPCYTISRRFVDFVYLSDALAAQFPCYVQKPSLSLNPFRGRAKVAPENMPAAPNGMFVPPATTCRQCLPLISKPLGGPWRSTTTMNHTRRKRQKKLDLYLYQLFLMPFAVHQCQLMFDFFTYQPSTSISSTSSSSLCSPSSVYLCSHPSAQLSSTSTCVTSDAIPMHPHRAAVMAAATATTATATGTSTTSATTSLASSSAVPIPKNAQNANLSSSTMSLSSSSASTLPKASPDTVTPCNQCKLMPKPSQSQPLPRKSSISTQNAKSAKSDAQSPTPTETSATCQPSWLLPPLPGTSSHTAGKHVTISLYLGPSSYVSVTLARDTMTLHELRTLLDDALADHALGSLPHPSVLAYHHVATNTREGALKTLTLNSQEPWIDCDNVMALASSHHIAFFSSSTPVPPTSLTNPDGSTVSPQKCIAQQWKYRHDYWPDDTKERVLLIATEKDLQAAMNGKWRRLDHVTLSCLAW
ncbi:hypothetical protein BC940DRAFT_363222 [Gongronella butleri]|nr:hypothetical protein BC940DRAFT_363222 [Gongronella butleri]